MHIGKLVQIRSSLTACLLLLFFIGRSLSAGAQCDCIDAITIKNSKPLTITSTGTGKLQEITDPDKVSMYFFEKEHNTGWFKFQIAGDGELTLSVSPSNNSDDLDFILFRYDVDGFCDRIRLKKQLPVRSNLARSGQGGNAETGLKKDVSQEFAHSGPGDAWSKSLPVKKYEVFYLVVDNVNGPNEYVVQVDLNEKKLKTNPEASPEVPENFEEIKTPFRMTVVDDETGKPVKGAFDIAGYQIGEPYRINDSSECTINLSSSQNITLNCNAPGYFFFTKAMMAPPIPYDAVKRPDTVKFEIRLKKAKPGQTLRLENIKFVGDDIGFLPSSRASLLSLHKFMEENPTAKIEIGGHVNAPDMRNLPKLKKLSKDRAKAVYDYLVEKGIEPSRIDYKGWGNSKMIYKKPLNEKQNEENRRVEVVVKSI
jgi:outer membrane protein OmpA-like peptidoglycan-associated protein